MLGLCDLSLKSRLGAEVDFQNMIRNKGFCVMKLHHLIKEVCNGSSGVMVEDIVGNMVEAMHNRTKTECAGARNCKHEKKKRVVL